jgi:uncharacterized repeat protein (TIGR01451 family)
VSGLTSFAPGAFVIDMGQATQTVANSLKPYGMVYDLVQNQHIPVDWAINPNKPVFGADFSAGGKSHSGGPFIIEAPFATAAAATIAKWRAQGVVVTQITTSFVAPIYNTITAFPRTVLDLANGKIAQAYYNLAGIPQFSGTVQDPTKAAYVFGTPLDLNQCNDVYVLPHADPSQWPASYKTSLLTFLNNGGWLFQECHSVSDFDVNVAHLLSSGLILYKNHKSGTPPYNYNPSTAADPEMQFTTRIDSATQNGSEEIYVPSAAGAWLPTTHVGVYDPDQPNASGTTLSKDAAVLAYGPAFGSSTAGWVMYEGGHSLSGTSPANVGAMRAFFDFILHAGIAHTPTFTASSFPSIMAAGSSGPVSATIALGNMKITGFQWTSSNGGTFTNQTAVTNPTTGAVTLTATFTAASLPTTITLTVSDDCGHQSILQQQILATTPPANRPPVAKNDTYTTPQGQELIVPASGSLLNNDSDPDGDPIIVSKFDSTSANGGTVVVNPDGTFTYTPKPGFTGTDTFTYTISDGKGGTSIATATITVTPAPPPTPTAPPQAKNDQYATNSTTPILGENIFANDTLNFATVSSVNNFKNGLVQWDGNPAHIPAAGTPYFTLDQATGNLNFYPNGYTGANPQFDYTLTNSKGSSKATVTFVINNNDPQANEDFATMPGYTTGQTPTTVIIPISNNDVSDNPNFVGWSKPNISGVPSGATATPVQIGTNSFGQPIWGIQYTPAPNHFTGAGPWDTFNYSVTEQIQNPTTGQITNGKNANTSDFVQIVQQPTANDDLYTVPENSGPTTLNVLSNDLAQGSPITIQSVNVPNGTTPGGGSVYVSDDGQTLIYQPAHGFTGTDTFTYTIVDGNGITSTATVTVNVPPTPNNPPVAVPDIQDPIPNNSTVPVGDTVTDNDSDQDGDPLTVTTIASTTGGTVPVPANPGTPAIIPGQFGTLVIDSSGNYTYQLNTTNPAVSGMAIGSTINDVFTYTISDGHGGTSTTTLTIPITRPDQPPVAVNDAYTTDAAVPLTIPAAQGVLADDSDPDPEDQGKLKVVEVNGNPAAVGQQITLPSGALLTVNPDGSFSYDPNHAFDNLAPGTTGTDSFTYAVTDPEGMVSTATAIITLTPREADLAVTKTVDNPTANVGDIVNFTVTVTNLGPDIADSVSVQDSLPAGFQFVSATPSEGSYQPNNGNWNVGTVDVTTPQTLVLTALVVSPGPLTNTATISHSNVSDPDGSNNSGSVTVSPPQADLSVAKTVSNPTPNVGDTITFTVTVTNAGPNAATGVQLTDLLPTGLSLVTSTPSQGSYAGSTGIWNVGTIASGSTATLQLQARVVSPAAQTNTASVSHADQFDPNTGNNSGTATETPQQADLQVGKTVSNPTPNVGDTITYTVTLTDNGPDPATNVTVQDMLPAGVTFVSAAPAGSYNPVGGVWTVGTVTPGSPQTLTITATVNSPNPGANTAAVSHSDQFDPNPANNSATASTNPNQADLAVSKTASNPTPNVGDTITYTVTLTDNGPSSATGVQLTDLLPIGLTLVSATPSQGTYAPATGLWVVGNLANGARATLSLQATVTAAGPQTNTATISAADQFDPNTGNNTASVTETPQQADLAVTKSVDNPRPNVGDTVTFTVTLRNTGPNTATNVLLNDLLPAGLSFVSAAPSQGVYNSSTGVWTVGSVPTTTAPKLTLTARVVSSTAQTNTATVSHSDQFDPTAGNNSGTATETPQQADLLVNKTVSDSTPNVGDTITYTVTVKDLGPDAATNVQVADLLPAGLTLISATSSQGSYTSATGLWSVGTVSTALAPTLTLTAQVVSSSPQTNTATVSAADQFDPDASNNQASVTETPQQADLKVQKSVDDSHPNVGDTITYTVTLTNLGPDAATGVQVTDLLPGGLFFLGATPSQGTYDGQTGLWSLGTVPNGTVETLQIHARVNSPNPQFNLAAVSKADQFDPNTGNNQAGVQEVPQQADLAVGKSVSNPTPNVGDLVTYTVKVTNNGPDAATGVVVQDILPMGVDYRTSSATQGSYDPNTRAWTVGTIPAGTVQTLTISVRVVSPDPQSNTATILAADQFDPDTANNGNTASIIPQQADLQLGKTVSNPTPNVGDTVTFTVSLTNNGFSAATNVQVSDLLPAGLTFVSATPSRGTYNGTTGVWTVGTVGAKTTQTLLIKAQVVSAAPQTNTATVSHVDQFDPDPGNNTASATETPERADLSLTKSVSDPTPNVGDTITFTVGLADLGPDPATNVSVQDLLPAGLTFVSASPSQGTYNGTSGLWTVGTVDPSVAQTLVLTARVASPNAVTNTATIGHSDQFDPTAANNSASATETPPRADLAISKTVSDPTPNVGDTVTFTVTLTNLGSDPATGVQVTDLLPAGLSLVLATPSQGAYDGTTGLWTVGDVGTTAPATLTLEAKVIGSTPATNVTTVSHADQFDPNTGNNSASATETPQQADLALIKSVSNPSPNVGDTVTFTVTLTNNGPDPASNVLILDPLPAGLTFVSAVPSQGTYDQTIGTWAVGTVTPNAPQTLTLTAVVASPAPQTNTATVNHSDQFDPNSSNNSASATESPQRADLQVSKTVSNPTPNVGDTVTFTVTLTNVGPATATNVAVQDQLPAGLTFVSATPSQGTYSSATGDWNVGTVSPTAPQTLLIQATVVSPSSQTNTATISHSDQFDPNTGNNSAGATETPQQADLQVSKTVSNPTPNVGDTITYTITLTDNGPDPATTVAVQDTLPAGVTYVSSSATAGAYDFNTGVWTVGTVNAGTPETLTITAHVTSDNPGTNTASVSHSDQFDPNTGNNSDSAAVDPQQAELAIAKTVSNSTPNVGDTVTFTVTLTDNGPASATGVQVTDLLPAGLTFVSDSPSQGTYSPATGLWTVGSLSNGSQATLVLQATVTAAGPRTNAASITHADQFDPNAGNNSASATETPQQADLVVSKTVDNPAPNVGDTVTFTVHVANVGPDAATNVTVQDLLPAGLTFVSDSPSQGTYSSATGIWNVGTVTPGTPETLTLTAIVAVAGARTNTAAVSHSDQFDPVTGNNSASVTETPQQADLQLTKTVDNATPNVGDTITYTITLSNSGPDAATGVTVNEPVPSGLTFISATTSTGSYDSVTGNWIVGTIANGGGAVLTLTARVVSSAAQTNTASITHADQFDPQTGNNTANATETPQQADLSVTKAVSNPTPNVGDTITFTVTVNNAGPNAATNVVLKDQLPAGLTFVSATTSKGVYDPSTGDWTVGTVGSGAAESLTLNARVTGSAALTNTATIFHSDQFDPDPANNTASVSETPEQADLAVVKTVSNTKPNLGDVITYTVTLTDKGPNAATNVVVHDLVPAGLTIVGATPGQGNYDPVTGMWTVGSVASGASTTLIIQARVVSPSPQTNTASVARADQFDPNPANNSGTITTTVAQADLRIAKAVTPQRVVVGQLVTYTIRVRNLGPDDAVNTVVTDNLPAGLTFISASASQGTYQPGTGKWSVGTVANGHFATLHIVARVTAVATIRNVASVGSSTFDPIHTNNTAAQSVIGILPIPSKRLLLGSVFF